MPAEAVPFMHSSGSAECCMQFSKPAVFSGLFLFKEKSAGPKEEK
jgi:hypothetical protein